MFLRTFYFVVDICGTLLFNFSGLHFCKKEILMFLGAERSGGFWLLHFGVLTCACLTSYKIQKGFFNNWQNLVFQGLSCFSMLCQAMLHYVTLCYLMLYYAMMCSVFSIYALLCYVCLCCASKKRLSLDMTPSLSFFWVRFRCGPGLGAWIASSEYGVKAQSPSQSEDP